MELPNLMRLVRIHLRHAASAHVAAPKGRPEEARWRQWREALGTPTGPHDLPELVVLCELLASEVINLRAELQDVREETRASQKELVQRLRAELGVGKEEPGSDG